MTDVRQSSGYFEVSSLESAILNLYFIKYMDKKFPSIDTLRIEKRKNTDAGRQLFFSHPGIIDLMDQKLFSGRYCYVEVASLRAGLSYWINIIERKVDSLVINVNGNYMWDNDERGWSIADPETGECNILQTQPIN